MLDALSPTKPAADLNTIACPYPGLRPFMEADARLFFGREGEVAAILQLLEAQQLVVVHGASGCGKSSVVRAGVVPIFRTDALANSRDGRVIIIRPADAGGPLASLARKLEREFPRAGASSEPGSLEPSWRGVLTASPDWAADISQAAQHANATLCLIVDQFEEIFGVNRVGLAAEARRLIEFLIGLGERAQPGTALGARTLSVILTMRSDYLGQCAMWDGFAETVNRAQYLLPKLSTLGLLRSIHEPARRASASVDDAVADRLLPVLRRELDGLPILQHALSRSWTFAKPRDGKLVVDAAALDAVGGAGEALSRHADEAFAIATRGDPKLQKTADWIIRSLSDLDSDGRIIRRSISLKQLASEAGCDVGTARAILDVFRGDGCNLIMPLAPDELTDDTIVSVSHEALLRQWKRVADPRFDESTGRPIGLVFREFHDGLIWRALVVQADAYARDHESTLGPAATEQRLPWYQDIAERPGWARRYQPQTSQPDLAEDQWNAVAALMDASRENLAHEVERLKQEQQMVKALRQQRQQIFVAYVLLFGLMLISFGTLTYQQRIKRDDAERAAAQEYAARLVAQDTAKAAQIQLYAQQTSTAHELADRYCAGQPAAQRQSCLTGKAQEYLLKLQAQASISDGAKVAASAAQQAEEANKRARSECANLGEAVQTRCVQDHLLLYLKQQTPQALPNSPFSGGVPR
jgi:hypothetical protein